MQTPENPSGGGGDDSGGSKPRSTSDLLAEADRLLEELPAQIEAARQERERAAHLRKKLDRGAARRRRTRDEQS